MNKKTRNLLIHGIIALAIYFIVSNLPPTAPLTEMGIQVLAIIIALIYGLITMEPAIPSIAAIILFGLTGYTSVLGAFMTAGGHYAVVMILGLMMLGGIMTHSGLAHALAKRIIDSRLANGRPWVLTFLILLAAMIPSMFLTAIPVLIIVWGIIKSIFELTGFQKGEKWPALMMAGVTASACLGISAMPFSMGVSTDFGIFMSVAGDVHMPAIPFLLTSIVLCAVFLVLELLVIRFVFRPDVSKLKNYKAPEKKEPFTKNQLRALVLLILFIVIVLLPDILPKGTPFQQTMAGFGVIGGSFLIVLIAICIRNKDGSSFITIQEIAHEGVFWSLLAMIAALMVVCSSMSDPALGIGAFLANLLSPVVQSLGSFGVYAVLLFIALVGTNLLDNTVVGMALASIVSLISKDISLSHVAVFCMLLHAAEYGILLPASSPLGAMTYGQIETGWVSRRTILTTALAFMLVLYAVLLVLGYPMLQLLS